MELGIIAFLVTNGPRSTPTIKVGAALNLLISINFALWAKRFNIGFVVLALSIDQSVTPNGLDFIVTQLKCMLFLCITHRYNTLIPPRA